jgi:hypothetical protein
MYSYINHESFNTQLAVLAVTVVAEERALREDALEILALFSERLLPRLD